MEIDPEQSLEFDAPFTDTTITGIKQGFITSNTTQNGSPQACQATLVTSRWLANLQAAQFTLDYRCTAALDNVEVIYQLFVDQAAGHQNLCRIIIGEKTSSVTLSRNNRFIQIPFGQLNQKWGFELDDQFAEDPNRNLTWDGSLKSTLKQQPAYFLLGIKHILLGIDHVLFLLALLLLPLKLRDIIAIVSAFTVAHSITLAAAVMDWVTLPAQWVELAIAASIIYVAVENLWLLRQQKTPTTLSLGLRRSMLTFGFGLIHGFGFSNVLSEIGLGSNKVSALLFFNLGVEVGQLAIVLLVLPLLLALFRLPANWLSARTGSILILAAGSFWLLQRL